jgi:hypothetical protein
MFSFICMFYGSLFVLLTFVFWPLWCLFLYDLRILITPSYRQTKLLPSDMLPINMLFIFFLDMWVSMCPVRIVYSSRISIVCVPICSFPTSWSVLKIAWLNYENRCVGDIRLTESRVLIFLTGISQIHFLVVTVHVLYLNFHPAATVSLLNSTQSFLAVLSEKILLLVFVRTHMNRHHNGQKTKVKRTNKDS